jgi:hypothetical protein
MGAFVIAIVIVAFWYINKRRRKRNLAGDTTGNVVQVTDSTMIDVGRDLNHYHLNYYSEGSG